jgi:transketolase
VKKNDIQKLRKLAIQIRKDVINMAFKAKDAHVSGALSIVEILAVLYLHVLKVNKNTTSNKGRDRFILSKGHGCGSLYSILARLGFFPVAELDKYCTKEGILGGHPDYGKIPGIELSTGSLGIGFPMGVGFAMAAKLEKSARKIYCIVGDGECNEGSIWEAAAVAAHRKLDNMIVIVDHNKMQSSGKGVDVQNPQDLKQKWSAFGWETLDVDGYDFEGIFDALSKCPLVKGKPTALIAHTVGGKGISFMENDNKWFVGIPNEEEYQKAMEELAAQEKTL